MLQGISIEIESGKYLNPTAKYDILKTKGATAHKVVDLPD